MLAIGGSGGDMNLLTARQAADELGISARLVRRLAVQMSVGERYSTQWLFTEADVEAMRQRNRQRGRTRGVTRPVPAR